MKENKQIKQLVAQGQIELALEYLGEKFKETDRFDEVIILAGKFRRLKDNEIKGVVTPGEISIENNRICSSILSLLKISTSDTYGSKNNYQSKIQLIIEGQIKDFDDNKKEQVIKILATLLNTKEGDIRILNVSSGSIKIILELPEAKKLRLLLMLDENNKLGEFIEEWNVLSIEDADNTPVFRKSGTHIVTSLKKKRHEMNSMKLLRELITNLSPHERAYLTKNMDQSTVSYRLFEAVRKFSVDTPLELTDERFSGRQLSSDAKRCYDKLLSHLNNYWCSNSRTARIKNYIIESDYLQSKSLYDQALTRLEKAEEETQQLGYLAPLLEIIPRKYKLLLRVNKDGRLKYPISVWNNHNLGEQIVKGLDYHRCYFDLMKILLKKHKASVPEEEDLKENYYYIIFSEDSINQDLQIYRRKLLCQALYYKLLSDTAGYNETYQKIAAWWDNKTDKTIKVEDVLDYMNDLTNLAFSYIELDTNSYRSEIEDIIRCFMDLKQQYKNNKGLRERIKLAILELEWTYFLNADQWSRIIDELLPRLSKIPNDDSIAKETILLLYNMMVAFFYQKAYPRFFVMADRILQLKSKHRGDLILATQALYLIGLFEEGKTDQIANKIRSIKRRSKSKYREFDEGEFYTYFASWMGKLISTIDSKRKMHYEKLDKKLHNSSFVKRTEALPGRQEIVDWVNEKLNNKTRFRHNKNDQKFN